MEALEAGQNSPCCPSSHGDQLLLSGFHSAIPSPDLNVEWGGALVWGYVEIAQQWGAAPWVLLGMNGFKANYGPSHFNGCI